MLRPPVRKCSMSPGNSLSWRSGVALTRIAAVSDARACSQPATSGTSVGCRPPAEPPGEPPGGAAVGSLGIDFRDRLVEEFPRNGEMACDDLGEVRCLV